MMCGEALVFATAAFANLLFSCEWGPRGDWWARNFWCADLIGFQYTLVIWADGYTLLLLDDVFLKNKNRWATSCICKCILVLGRAVFSC